jgi:ATP phosphoribosyltransferase
MKSLTVALPKGRLLISSLELFKKIGVRINDYEDNMRRLIFDSDEGSHKFMIVKPFDVPTYVEYGIADLGIVGGDVLMETGRDVYEPLDLKFGRCKLVLAVPKEQATLDISLHSNYRVATKYPNITKRYFLNRGIQVEVIRLYGSVELGPITGLAEMIVDLVETGRTLRENGLVPIAEISSTSAKLIVNRASHKINFNRIRALIERLKREIG